MKDLVEGDLIVFNVGNVKIPLQITEINDKGFGKIQIYKENNLVNFNGLDNTVEVSIYRHSKCTTETTIINRKSFLEGQGF